jgi:TP901 family phage tail tape measure protein
MSEELELNVRLAMESQSFQQQISNINRQMSVVQSEFNSASSRLGEFGSATDKLIAKSASLTQQIELGRSKTTMYAEAVTRSRETLERNVIVNQELRQRLEETTRAHAASITATGRNSEESGRLHAELTQLTQEYNNSNGVVANNSRALDNNTIRANNAERSINQLETQLRETDNQLRIQSSDWTRLGTTMTNAGNKMKAVGTKMSDVGTKLFTGLTLPIIGAGVAMGKLSLDFEASMAKVSTISDDSQVPIGDLRKAILKLSDDTGIASTEIANNVYDAISAGQSTADAVNFVTNATKLAKSGFAEAGESLDLLTTILNSYGLKSSEVNKVSDILVQTQNKGKVTVGELAQSMGKIIPTANALGVNLEQVASGYAIMTSKGIKSAEATTYMASMLNEMGKSGTSANKVIEKATGKTFPELIKSGKSVGDILNIMNDYAKKNGKSLTDMFGSAEAGKSALILSNNAGKDFNEMLKSMGLSAGETDKAFAKVNDVTGVKLAKSLNALKNSVVKMGDALTPIIEKLASGMQKLADKFNSITPEQQEMIIKTAGIIAVAAPLLIITGKLISAFGVISGAIGAVSTAMGIGAAATAGVGVAGGVATTGIAGLGAAVGTALVPLLPFIAAIGAVVATGFAIKHVLDQEVIPEVDLFADKSVTTSKKITDSHGNIVRSFDTVVTKISDGTEKAVGAYIKLDDDATKSLSSLYVNSTKITTEIATTLTTKYNEMGNQIKNSIDGHFKESYKTMQTFFNDSSALTAEEEAKALAKLNQDNEHNKTVTDIHLAKIQAILKIASDEKRALTLNEQIKINEIQNTMKINAVKTLSDGEVESKVILERLKAYTTRITTEQASEEIKNANKAKDGTILAANEKYSKSIAEIIKMRDESHSITADQASKLIKDAQSQRDGTIKNAEEMRAGVISKITAMNTDVVSNINISTGDILTSWDKLKNWWGSWFPEKKNLTVVTTYEERVSNGGKPDLNSHIGKNSSGTDYWKGGLTTMHEEKYELYNLPRASKIYNHDASEDMVLKTAQEVAKGVLSSSGGKGITQTVNIYSPNALNPSDTARANRKVLQEMAFNF